MCQFLATFLLPTKRCAKVTACYSTLTKLAKTRGVLRLRSNSGVEVLPRTEHRSGVWTGWRSGAERPRPSSFGSDGIRSQGRR